ncbi:hypothetical protein BGZ58_004535 [Dissophora ornata]|nr:hypothetical protein BGZ58_004535 [Dissophora ornata]
MDSDMASPIETPALALVQNDVNQTVDGAEPKLDADITTRTIKKFKSLRRSNISTQPQKGRPQQDTLNQDDLPPAPGAKIGNSPTAAPSSSVTSSSRTTNSSQAPAPAKPKAMKRSKTIVFRPEVSMQPLSSKNVIPPWNRIPLVTSNTGNSNSPSSPVSPTTPTSLNSYGMLFSSTNSPNTIVGENVTETTPAIHDPEDRPRKMTMSHSKTMSAISSMSSFSYWGSDSSSTSATSNASFSSASAVSNGNGSSISVNGGSNVRSMSTSSSATTLVAPWNRVNPNVEPNTHLHSLIKVSGPPSQSSQQYSSSSNSTYIPVELGRSFQKKELQKSHAMATRSIKDQSVPVLTQPPEARNKMAMTSRFFEVSTTPPPTRNKGLRSGMTHSVSAPGGFLPLMTASAPEEPSSPSEAQFPETANKSSFELTAVQSKAPATKKRSPRRESSVGLNSPSQSTKQPVGILKNSQNRKASLTVPVSNMFPVQSNTSSTPTTAVGHQGSSIATTFKIVIDADTIVALQVFEDKSFVLTLKELRMRVKNKLLKSNIQLSENFDLIWVVPSSASSSALNTPATPSTPTTPSSTSASTSSASIFHMSDPGVALRSEEDLQRAIRSSRNHKVTLRCML